MTIHTLRIIVLKCKQKDNSPVRLPFVCKNNWKILEKNGYGPIELNSLQIICEQIRALN